MNCDRCGGVFEFGFYSKVEGKRICYSCKQELLKEKAKQKIDTFKTAYLNRDVVYRTDCPYCGQFITSKEVRRIYSCPSCYKQFKVEKTFFGE